MLDATQLSYMSEQCIQVTPSDQVIGPIDKQTSHLADKIQQDNLLHRAFSVFIFNAQGELLLQRRAAEKITFPDCWTNTCCSHPLYNPREIEGIAGVKRAAVRKLEHELGIVGVKEEELVFVSRIHYKAIQKGEVWGEHEVDYILFLKKDVKWALNPNEVSQVQFVSPSQLKNLLEDKSVTISPWFALICDKFIFQWWERLDEIVRGGDQDDPNIHKLGQH
jgi:isopentenyl-diphosphate delta-isomerase